MAWFTRPEISDAEFVEKVRRNVRWHRLWGCLALVLGVVYGCLNIAVIQLLTGSLSEMSLGDSYGSGFDAGVIWGLIVGGLGTTYFVISGLCFWQFIDGLRINRRSRLLIAYHDELIKLRAMKSRESGQ